MLDDKLQILGNGGGGGGSCSVAEFKKNRIKQVVVQQCVLFCFVFKIIVFLDFYMQINSLDSLTFTRMTNRPPP